MKEATIKAAKGLWKAFPMMLGTVLMIGLISALVPKSFYTTIFSKNQFLDSIIGGVIGSVSIGNPITSYILGGELLAQGTSLVAVTTFLVTWVTVGLVQLPAEAAILGRKFSIVRNLTAFVLSLVVAITTVFIVKIL